MKKQKLFIVVFMASILLPNIIFAVFYRQLDTANNENRTLAEFPGVSPAELEKFPEKFEAFYNDHVPFKNYLMRLNYQLDTKVFFTTKKGDVTIGKDNWLFYTPERDGEDAMADYKKTNQYSEEECMEISENIARAEAYIKGQGVENFVYYVAPNKETLYPQYMPSETRGDGPSRMESFGDYMGKNADADFCYLYHDLADYSRDYQIFYKYDTHMNYLGSFLVSQIMAENLTGESVSLEDVTVVRDEPFVGDLARMVNQEDSMTDDYDWVIEGYHPEIKYDIIKDSEDNGEEILREYVSDSPNSRTLLVVGDSYRLKLEPYLAKLYDHTVFVRIDDFTPELLEEYAPQDVAVITVERNQKYMENLDEYLAPK